MTAVDWPPVVPDTVAEKVKVPPVETLAEAGATVTEIWGDCVTVTVAVAFLDESATLVELAIQANSPGWWHKYGDVLPDWFQVYVGL